MSLSIAIHINKQLAASAELKEKVGDRFYPVSVKSDVQAPFIVYERDSVQPNGTKDGTDGDTVAVNVYVFAETYMESVEIAELVRDTLDGSSGSYTTFEVDECDFTDAAETYEDGIYAQQLVFNLTTYKNK